MRDQLVEAVALLRREGRVDLWHDRRITAGDEWKGQIDDHLRSAHLILLLISPSFIASDYCYDIEMTAALERSRLEGTPVIPVILRPCDWRSAPFAGFQVLPDGAEPITSWRDRDAAFENVVNGLRQRIGQLQGRHVLAPKPITGAASATRERRAVGGWMRRAIAPLTAAACLAIAAGVFFRQVPFNVWDWAVVCAGSVLLCFGAWRVLASRR